jgi:hypothetical protein
MQPNRDAYKESVLLHLLDTSELIQQVEYVLRGYKFDYETDKWIPRVVGYARTPEGKTIVTQEGKPIPLYSPMMNEIGISRVMGFFQTQVTKVTQATDLDYDEINRLSEESAIWILDELYLNYDVWNVQREDLHTIVLLIDHTNFKVCKQAFKDGNRKLLGETHSVNELVQRQEEGRKKGWLW